MNLLLFEPGEIHSDGTAVVADARARHLREVLRVQPGQDVRVGVVDGGLGAATVVSLNDRAVILQCRLEADDRRYS